MGFFNTLKRLLTEPDNVSYSDEMTTELQINEIDESNEVAEDIKSELKKSLSKIDKQYIFNTSEREIKRVIDEENINDMKNIKVKVDSVRAMADTQNKVNKIKEEKEKE